ncbi:MAG: twin-arginine translocase TatA/TatE family subunit [Mesorhizobium sp.]|nr:MAG: twin-arginine translocase TatA/TatE family subunit [Mesorhizobium sp.]
MGLVSTWHWVIVGLILILMFGRGMFSRLLGDIGIGIGAFKRTLRDDVDARLESRQAASRVGGAAETE